VAHGSEEGGEAHRRGDGEGRRRGAAGLGIERFNKLEAQREGWRGVRERIDD
jgi:hypothetical protein